MGVLLNKEGICEHLKRNNLRFDWINFSFVFGFILFSIIGVPLYYLLADQSPDWRPWALCFVLYWMTGMGITMGYHRYFSHKTFKTNSFVSFVMMLLGTMSLQNSVIKWSNDHRVHHRLTDKEGDPYNASYGFLWSHILWIFYSEKYTDRGHSKAELQEEFSMVKDLIASPVLRWQHRYYFWLTSLLNVFIPIGFAYALGGSFIEYFIVAGIFRIFIVHQSTFFINSLAHLIGERPYNAFESARDSFICSILAFGEGYHNYHHSHPTDYRNGLKFYHFDPTKWIIYGLSLVGMTSSLKRTKLAGR